LTFKRISAKASDLVAGMTASWLFAIAYTSVMLLWIGLHVGGAINIDSAEFPKYNLFLSWWAGTQASIVLMASNRQSDRDRTKLDKGIELDRRQLDEQAKAHDKIGQIATRINSLESILALMEGEEREKTKRVQKATKAKAKGEGQRPGRRPQPNRRP
jgi:uncharacterized membrane protein